MTTTHETPTTGGALTEDELKADLTLDQLRQLVGLVEYDASSDPFPVTAMDAVCFVVGNATQTATFYQLAFGMDLEAYRGPENGLRDAKVYVLRSGSARFVFAGGVTPDSPLLEHHRKHGDGVVDLALEVPDVDRCIEHARSVGATILDEPYDISDEQARDDIGRLAVMVLSYAAQSARGLNKAIVPQKEVDEGATLAEKFLIRWKGEADPKHVKAIDAYWSSAAEHGMNASTFTARVITSTGADVAAAFSGAIGAMSGPLHGGAPSRVLGMISDVEESGDAEAYVKGLLDRGERLMGFGHRVYRAEDPRARVLRRTAKELDAPRYAVAEALEQAALKELRERRPDRVLETNVEFWAAIVLDFAEVPANMFTSMFTCARTGGWSAHILEQKRTGRLIRPSAVYTGPGSRPASEIEGWQEAWGA